MAVNDGGSTTTDNAKVMGKAVYAGGAPAKNASVRVRPDAYVRSLGAEPDSITRHDTLTNDSGSYYIDSLKIGKYRIEINDNTASALLEHCEIKTLKDSIGIPTDTLRRYEAIAGIIDSSMPRTGTYYVQVKGLDRIVKADSATGAFKIADLPEGTYSIRVFCTDTEVRPVVIDSVKADTAGKPVVIDTTKKPPDTTSTQPVGNASWTQVGPDGGGVSCFAVIPQGTGGSAVFAGTDYGGVYVSNNNGVSWSPAYSGVRYYVRALAAVPNLTGGYTLFAGVVNEGIFRSTDNGSLWTAVGSGPTLIENLAVHGGTLYAIETNYLSVTNDNGFTWSMLPTRMYSLKCMAVGADGADLYAGSQGSGVYHSADSGATWSPANTGLTDTIVSSLAVSSDGTTVVAGTSHGVFRTIDKGSSWTLPSGGTQVSNATAFVIDAATVYAGTSSGVFRSTDNGVQWTRLGASLNVSQLATAPQGGTGGLEFYAGNDQGLFISADTCVTWSKSITGLSALSVWTVAANKSVVCASTSSGVFYSRDNGANWTVTLSTRVYAFACVGGSIFAGADNAVVEKSVDNGATWTPSAGLASSGNVTALAASPDGTRLFAGTAYENGNANAGGVYMSIDSGAHWTAAGAGLPTTAVNALAFNRSTLLAGTVTRGVFLTNDNGATWTSAGSGLNDSNVQSLFANKGILYAGTYLTGVFVSADNGKTWTPANTGFPYVNDLALSFASVGGTVFAGVADYGVFRTDNNGALWTADTTGLYQKVIYGLAANDTYLFAGTDGASVWRRPLK